MALRRVAKEDVTYCGKLIKAGEGIICSNQSANRDEEVFPDPDGFDLHRNRGSEQALGFGFGEHQCVAEWLARAELEIVFATIFKKLPNLELAVPFEEIKYTPPEKDTRIAELPITF